MGNFKKEIFRFIFLFFFFFFANTVSTYAEEDAISINDALAASIASHPNIVGKRNELVAASENLQTSKWQRFPSLSLQTSAGQNSTTKNTSGVITTIRLEQPLWTGGRISGNIDASTARTLAAEQSVYEIEQDILIKTATAYLDMIRMQLKLEASKENFIEHQRLLDLIERRARSEVSPMSEIVLAKSRLAQARSENIQFRTQAANAKSDLQTLIGRPIKAIISPNISLSLPKEQQQAIDTAIEYSPTLRKLAAQDAAAEAEIRVAKSNLYPQISVRSDEINGSAAPGNTTYLALTYSPGNGLSSISSGREASAKREVAGLAIESSRLDIGNKVRTDWNTFNSESAQIEVLSNLVETSRGVYQSSVRQFAAGRKTWVEVLNARKEATQARYQLADSEWNSFLAGIRVEVMTGLITGDNPDLK